jgi:hypothetical protein
MKSTSKELRSLHPLSWQTTKAASSSFLVELRTPVASMEIDADESPILCTTCCRRRSKDWGSLLPLIVGQQRFRSSCAGKSSPHNRSNEACFDEPWPVAKLSGLQEVVTVTAPFRCSDGRRVDRLAGAKQNPRPKEMPIRTASRDGHPGRQCLSPLSHELSLCEAPHRLFVGMLGGFVDWTF